MKGLNPPRGERTQAVREFLALHPQASIKDVVQQLLTQGIQVSEALAAKIKYRKGMKKPFANGQVSPARGLAGSRGFRSQAIKAYLEVFPQASPAAVVRGLAEEGIEVKPGLVSAIKSQKLSQHASFSSNGSGRHSSGGGILAHHLLAAKRLCVQLGSIKRLRRLLDSLEQADKLEAAGD